MSHSTQELPPHRLRWGILFLLFLAMTVNILDRRVLSLVAPVLRDELRLSNTQYGVIVFSFPPQASARNRSRSPGSRASTRSHNSSIRFQRSGVTAGTSLQLVPQPGLSQLPVASR